MTGSGTEADPAVEEVPLPLEVEELLGWLRVEKGRSPTTLTAYRGDLRRYCAWLHGRGASLDAVGEEDVTAYVAHLRLAAKRRCRFGVAVAFLS